MPDSCAVSRRYFCSVYSFSCMLNGFQCVAMNCETDMDAKQLKVFALLIVMEGCALVNAVTLTESYRPQPAILGNNNFTIQADYTLFTSETLDTMSLLTNERRLMAQFNPANPSDNLSWRQDTPQNVRNRATAHGSAQLAYLEARFRDTKCEDINTQYLFQLSYYAGQTLRTSEKTVSIRVEARPKAPTMQVTPNTQNVTEFTVITITCSGNVGRPAGSFQWFTFDDDVSSASEKNVTDLAQPGVLSPGTGDESCTFTRTSVLTLNVTRRAEGKRLVVRCRVYHPTQGNSDYMQCQNPDSDYCQMTQQIDVQYPVEVTVDSDAVNAEEGKETTLTCHIRGNPDPYLVEWNKEGDKETLSSTNSLQLTDLQLNDTGTYICTAYNTVEGTTRNASRSIYVSVQKTTPPPPTTTTTTAPIGSPVNTAETQLDPRNNAQDSEKTTPPPPTTTTTTAPTSSPSNTAETPLDPRNNAQDSDVWVGPVVGTLIGVALLAGIVIVAVLWYRRRKGKNGTSESNYEIPDDTVVNTPNQIHNQTTDLSNSTVRTEENSSNYYYEIRDFNNTYDQLRPYNNDEECHHTYKTLG